MSEIYNIVILLILFYIAFTLHFQGNNKKNETKIVEKIVENKCCDKDPVKSMEINIPTRGCPEETRQLGVLTTENAEVTVPLYGRRLWNGSNKWNYFTRTDKFISIILPVYKCNKNCFEEYGCDELYDNDIVEVPQLTTQSLKVTLYHTNVPRYIPCI
tara:strand:- start:724 stop:1197 length:474 start_codon:yes stop_codon:yes gene_type:complete